jgi:hypothetical protein
MAPGLFLTGYDQSGSFYPDNLERPGNAGVICRSSSWRNFATVPPGVREAGIQVDETYILPGIGVHASAQRPHWRGADGDLALMIDDRHHVFDGQRAGCAISRTSGTQLRLHWLSIALVQPHTA